MVMFEQVATGDLIQVGPLMIRFLVTGADSNGSAAVFELTVPAGEKLPAPAHSHDGYEETAYGLSGRLVWTIDGRPTQIGPGEAVCIPRGAVHRFDNVGREPARALMVATPAGIGPDYFREVAEALAAGGPPDPARMGDILRRHGLTPVKPGA